MTVRVPSPGPGFRRIRTVPPPSTIPHPSSMNKYFFYYSYPHVCGECLPTPDSIRKSSSKAPFRYKVGRGGGVRPPPPSPPCLFTEYDKIGGSGRNKIWFVTENPNVHCVRTRTHTHNFPRKVHTSVGWCLQGGEEPAAEVPLWDVCLWRKWPRGFISSGRRGKVGGCGFYFFFWRLCCCCCWD